MTLWYASTDERGREAERKEKPGHLRRSIIQGHFRPVPSGTCFGNGEVHGTYCTASGDSTIPFKHVPLGTGQKWLCIILRLKRPGFSFLSASLPPHFLH